MVKEEEKKEREEGRKKKKGWKRKGEKKGKKKEKRRRGEGERKKKRGKKKKEEKKTHGRGPQVVLFVAPPKGATTLQSNQNLKSPPAPYRGDLNDFGCSQSLPGGGAKLPKKSIFAQWNVRFHREADFNEFPMASPKEISSIFVFRTSLSNLNIPIENGTNKTDFWSSFL